MQSQSAKHEDQCYEQALYQWMPEAIRASNRLHDALGIRQGVDAVHSEPPGPLQTLMSHTKASAPPDPAHLTTSGWRGHASRDSVDSTIDAEHEIIDESTEVSSADKQPLPKIVIHRASPRPEDFDVAHLIAHSKRHLPDEPESQTEPAPKRIRVLDPPFEMVPRPAKSTVSSLFDNYPPASPPPKHKDPPKEYADAHPSNYWRPGLSQNLTLWLEHPTTESAQVRLLSLKLNIIALREQEQGGKLYFTSDSYHRLDSFRIRLPLDAGSPQAQDWLGFVCVSAGISGDGFDSDYEEDEYEDDEDGDPGPSYWVMMVQTQHAIVVSNEPIEEEEGEGLGLPLLSEDGSVRGEKTKTRLLINRVPWMHGRGINPRFAHDFFIACGYANGVFDVVSEGELPLGSV